VVISCLSATFDWIASSESSRTVHGGDGCRAPSSGFPVGFPVCMTPETERVSLKAKNASSVDFHTKQPDRKCTSNHDFMSYDDIVTAHDCICGVCH
jgi:hypothetical protein